MSRLLIRADNWRYRSYIAAHGQYPDAADIGERYQSDFALAQGRAYWDRSQRGETLPERGHGGYAVAYLEVSAHDERELSRNEWDAGDSTVCATCAENNPPSIGDAWGYYPLLQMNGEISGNNDMRVFRCERCGEIILDYETLAIVVSESGEQETYRYDASDIVKAEREYSDILGRLILDTDAQPWSIALLDCERMLDGYESGERWPLEIIAAMDSYRCDIAAHIAAGQSQLPGFPTHPVLAEADFPALADPLPAWMQEHGRNWQDIGYHSHPYIPYVPMVPLALDAAQIFDIPTR